MNILGTMKYAFKNHRHKILKEGELAQDSVVKNYLTTADGGKQYDVNSDNSVSCAS